jgi:hypothetical protein
MDPAPDPEGRNEDPTGQFLGRIHDEVLLAPGIDPTAVAVMSKFGSNPATWVIPPAENTDLSPNPYTDFRFLLYNVSRLGTDASGSGGPGTYTLQTAAWPGGTDHFILTPVPHPGTLDVRAANPATIALPLTGGNGLPLTVSAGGITTPYLGNASVTAAQMAANSITAANNALAANSVVDPKIVSLGINKVTYGTSVFAGDVILSRGIGLPVIVLANTGITLFGQADASTGVSGLTSKPYVQIYPAAIKLYTGFTGSATFNGSMLLDAATNSLTLYSKDADTTYPYFTVSVNGLVMTNGPNSVAINTNAMTFNDTQFHNNLTMNSAGMSVSNGNNKLVILSNAIQLQYAGAARITIDATTGITLSNGGTSSVTITASAVAIVNGTFHYVAGGTTVDINPSISTVIGTVNGMSIVGSTFSLIMTSSALTVCDSGGSSGRETIISSGQFYAQTDNAHVVSLQPTLFEMTHLPSTNPGAGTKQFYYTPADGIVRYAA